MRWSTLKATTGWLQKSKSRHGIRQLGISSEKLPSNFESADNFKKKILLIIKEKGYNTENIYNADETGLNLKALPKKTLVLRNKKICFSVKNEWICVTIMTCANERGSHRLKLTD